jgi:hypothetical protein
MSSPNLNPALNLFQVENKISQIQDVQKVSLKCPFFYPEAEQFVFEYIGSERQYLSLNDILLEMTFQVQNPDGSPATSVDQPPCLVSNLALHTFWQKIELYLNDTLINDAPSQYTLVSYLEVLLDPKQKENKNRLKLQGFYRHENEDVSVINPLKSAFVGSAIERMKLSNTDKKTTLIGPLKLGFVKDCPLLLDMTKLKIKLWRHSNSHYLITESDKGNFKVVLTDLTLHITKYLVSPETFLAQNQILMKNSARYGFRNTTVRQFSLNAGESQFHFPNIFAFKIPDRVFMVFLDTMGHIGSYNQNAYNFLNQNLSKLQFSINDVVDSATSFSYNFDENMYLGGYCSMMNMASEGEINISYIEYKNGFTVFCCDLKQDTLTKSEGLCTNSISKLKRGVLDIKGTFKHPLERNTTVIIVCDLPCYVHLDYLRLVTKQHA